MLNPFEFGRELSPDELVDREEELSVTTAAMLRGGKLFLIGPRRYGKTSILRAATDAAERQGAVVLRYDAEAFPTLDQLAARLLADTATRLTGSVEKAGTAIKEFFASVQPQASFDPASGRWTVSIGIAHADGGGVPLLADVLDGVERAAGKARAPVSVVIDEFQKVVEAGGADAEGQIRAAIQRHRHVGYVFAGSKTRLLADMTGEPNRPFYKLGTVRFVGPVPRGPFADFLQRGFAAARIPVESGAVDAILDAAEEVPYNVQLLAHAVWETCRADAASARGRPRTVTPALVKHVRDTVALRYDPLYTRLWSTLTAPQQKVLLALLREPNEGLTSTAVARRYNLPVPTMQTARQALEAKEIIREEQTLGTGRLRLEDPLFGAWIELVIPR